MIACFGSIQVERRTAHDVSRIACILNPKARDGLSIKHWEGFEPALREAGFEIDLHHTEEPGHAMDIARDLCDGDHELVVAVGGDGTVHEVASGLRGSDKALGILPIGSGNDYARAHGIPTPRGNKFKDMQVAVDILVDGTDRRVGAIRVEGPPAPDHPSKAAPVPRTCNGEPENIGNLVRWSFLESDGGVTSVVNRMKDEGQFKRIRGQMKYTLLAIKAIIKWKKESGTIAIDGGAAETIDLSGLFCMSMCQTFGGGYRVAPGAKPTQGHASLVTAWGLSKSQMLRLMGPLEKGKHIGMWSVAMQDASRIEFGHSSGAPMFINVDGEAVITTPATMHYHDDQLTVRGAASIPNE
jgi:diacylglycerol kinase family enzyme